jgi:hypothetical protein
MNQTSDREALVRAYLDRINNACDKIILWVFKHGTLAQFPRVTEYLGKENGGPGWEDSYQNFLISRLCASSWFERDSKSSELFRCTVDGSSWYRYSDEWRMNAYKEQLSCKTSSTNQDLPVLGAATTQHPVFFSEDFFRTVGFDPIDAQRIDLEFWVSYLTELRDGSNETLKSSSQEQNETKQSAWKKLLRLLQG